MNIPFDITARGETEPRRSDLDVTSDAPKSWSAQAIVDVMERAFCRATLQGSPPATFDTAGQTAEDTIGHTVIRITTATDELRIGPVPLQPEAVAEAVRVWNAAIAGS